MVPAIDRRWPDLVAAVRMLFEMLAADGDARRCGLPLAVALGADPASILAATDTNQTLFWHDDASLLTRAMRYAERGFLQLKLRIGIAEFSDDLRRLSLLRDRLGPRARISVDANGRWPVAEAPQPRRRLAIDRLPEHRWLSETPISASDTARLSR